MTSHSIERYQKRYKNFDNAYKTFFRQLAVYQKAPSETSEIALIHAFAFTFDMSWKILKDFLTVKGILSKNPRDTLKSAYQQEIITDIDTWFSAIEIRNQTVHTYEVALREEAILFITREFVPQIEALYPILKETPSTKSSSC